VRRGDVVRLGPQLERDGCLVFTEEKNAAKAPKQLTLPILGELRQAIDATPSGHLSYLVTVFGKPYTKDGFANWFRRRCAEAGLIGCSAHGLRKAGAVRAAMAGATTRQLMAIFGWQSATMADRYTREADRKILAAESIHLLGRKAG
jgi:integrase